MDQGWWFTVALAAGWCALVVWAIWPEDLHCQDCPRRKRN